MLRRMTARIVFMRVGRGFQTELTAKSGRMPLPLPRSREEVRRIQRERKRIAVEHALRSPFWQGRIPKQINLEKLEDPAVWRSIPILDKETLRALPDVQFYGEFCHQQHDGVAEYWRSGGVTGQPLF